MKKYAALKKRLELCLICIETLQEQKDVLNAFLYPRTSRIKPVCAKGGTNNDRFSEYVYETMTIDNQIEIVKKEVDTLKKSIKKMEYVLRDIDGAMYKIFVYKYIDGLSVNQISHKINLSPRRVYQYLDQIKIKLEK